MLGLLGAGAHGDVPAGQRRGDVGRTCSAETPGAAATRSSVRIGRAPGPRLLRGHEAAAVEPGLGVAAEVDDAGDGGPGRGLVALGVGAGHGEDVADARRGRAR